MPTFAFEMPDKILAKMAQPSEVEKPKNKVETMAHVRQMRTTGLRP